MFQKGGLKGLTVTDLPQWLDRAVNHTAHP